MFTILSFEFWIINIIQASENNNETISSLKKELGNLMKQRKVNWANMKHINKNILITQKISMKINIVIHVVERKKNLKIILSSLYLKIIHQRFFLIMKFKGFCLI